MSTRILLSASLALATSTLASATDYFVDYDGAAPPAPIEGVLSQLPVFGDPKFDAPLIAEDGTCLPGEGIFTRYEKITVSNQSGVPVELGLEVNTANCMDFADNPLVFVYEGSFDPNAPTMNCRIANDNYRGFCGRVIAPIAAGDAAVFVITSYYADEAWPWIARFNDTIVYASFENYVAPAN